MRSCLNQKHTSQGSNTACAYSHPTSLSAGAQSLPPLLKVKVVMPPPLADLAAGRPVAAVIQDFTPDAVQGAAQDDAAGCSYVYVCRKPY